MNNKRHTYIPCRPHPLALALACALAGPAFAQNLPGGFNGVSGVNTPTTVGNTMTVTQTAQRGIAEWQNFSIGSGYRVRFNQPGSSSVLLNRVVGNDRSTIAGNITANGHIYLINPNGVLFSQGASVNVGGLIASTLDISNNEFLKGGALKFSRLDGNDAAVINEGSITAASGGTIGLMAARVTNSGTLSAPDGTVGLVSARTVNVDFDGDGLTTFTIPDDSLASAAWVENSGQVDADGGRIALLAASTVREQVVKQSGTLRARSLSTRGGEIVLGGDTASGNEMHVGGELDVSGTAAGVAGGTVKMEASTVLVEGARIDASGTGQGGSIAISAGAGNVGLFNGSADASGTKRGGNISVHADTDPNQSSSGIIAMDKDFALHADATGPQGDGGRIVLLGETGTRAHGVLTARAGSQGGDGGFIETSGGVLELGGIHVDASAPAGKAGEWLLDPYDIYIDHGMGLSTPPNWFESSFDNMVVFDGEINYNLNLGTSVTIVTGAGGTQDGDITFGSGVQILKTSGGNATLTLNAINDIKDEHMGGHVNSIIQSTSGTLNIEFFAGRQVTYAGSIYTNGGSVTMQGSGSGGVPGVMLSGATIDTRAAAGVGGWVRIIGTGVGNSSPGVWIRNYGSTPTRINTASGYVWIDGASWESPATPGQSNYGISIWDSHIETTTGAITLVGRSGGMWWGGVLLQGNTSSSTITSTNGGRIDIAGTAFTASTGNAYGIQLEGNSIINSSGEVILRASTAASQGNALVIVGGGQVNAGSVLSLRPGEVDTSGNPVDRPTDVIVLGGPSGVFMSLGNFGNLVAPTIVVGSNAHTGNITVNGSITTTSALTLQNGSGGITLNSSVNAPKLGLVSAGNIMQNSGVITANNLYARSSGNSVSLKSINNNVNTLSGGAGTGGSFEFVNSSALSIGPVSVTGYNPAAPGPMTISAPANTLSANTVLVQTLAGDLTLAMPVSSTSGTDLVAAGVFQNPGAFSIIGPWRVWASTWAGETRGGLVGTGDDILGCAWGSGSCTVGTGNYFIYATQTAYILPLPEEVRNNDYSLTLVAEEEDPNEKSEGADGGDSSPDPGSGFVLVCLDTLLSGDVSDSGYENDVLGREWSRLRAKPRTSNCLGVDGRQGCASF